MVKKKNSIGFFFTSACACVSRAGSTLLLAWVCTAPASVQGSHGQFAFLFCLEALLIKSFKGSGADRLGAVSIWDSGKCIESQSYLHSTHGGKEMKAPDWPLSFSPSLLVMGGPSRFFKLWFQVHATCWCFSKYFRLLLEVIHYNPLNLSFTNLRAYFRNYIPLLSCILTLAQTHTHTQATKMWDIIWVFIIFTSVMSITFLMDIKIGVRRV